MMDDITLVITETDENRLIKDILRNNLKISSGLLTKLKKCGGIRLNGKTVTVVQRVAKGDTLTVDFPEEKSSSILPSNIPLDIVYEDECVLVVNKPKDMPTHPSIGNRDNTLGNACMYYFRNTDFVYRPINRLDRDTTGLVVIAKDARTSAIVSGQTQNGIFHKTYYAIIDGIPHPKSGTINAPIGRADGSILKREVRNDGQRAVTSYQILCNDEKHSLAEINLLTGRTHQIRVHFSHIGTPLLYDYMYGTEITGETLYLHCGRIEFDHPNSGEKLVITKKPKFPFFKEYLEAL